MPKKRSKRPKGGGTGGGAPRPRRQSRARPGRALAFSPRGQMQRAAGWPLHECRVNPDWQDRLAASVVVARRRPDGGLAVGMFFVDLGCLGVTWANGLSDLSPRRYRELVGDFADRHGAFEPCAPALAARIVEAGLRYGDELGFLPDPDFAWVKEILGDIDPATCEVPVECGRDGKPLYLAGPDDDAPAVIAHLERRLGRDGFRFIAPLDVCEEPDLEAELDEVACELASTRPREGDEEALLLRCGRLKRLLVLLAQSERVAEERWRLLEDGGYDEAELDAAALEHLLVSLRLPDGRRLHDLAAETPGLSGRDRELLLSWKDDLLGIFEIRRLAGDHLVFHNLLDELVYRVRSNVGTAALRQFPVGSFCLTRLLPFGYDWLLSGEAEMMPGGEVGRGIALEAAAVLARSSPRALFRNPELLERAWRGERESHEVFVECFGTDEVLLAGGRLQEAVDGLWAAQQARATAALGTTVEQLAAEHGGLVSTSFPLPDSLLVEPDVGVLSDPVWGLGFYERYGELRSVFAAPGRAAEPKVRELVLGYLDSPSVDPLPFLHLARDYPEGASEVLARVLGRPGFDWGRDGEALLHERKAACYPPWPRTAPLRDELVQALGRANARQAGGGRDG